MAIPNIYTLSPVKCNATILAIHDPIFDPAIIREGFDHSGNPYASAVVKSGAVPSIRFRTPFLAAYTLFGFKAFKLTTFEFYFAKFTDFLKDPGAVHPRYKLGAAQLAAARIIGASVGFRGVLMADVEVVPLATVGMTNPLVQDTAALPVLGAQPALHTLGPCQINGTRINGVRNQGFDLGIQWTAEQWDGDLYLTSVNEMKSSPSLAIEHGDPIAVLAACGLLGTPIASATKLYFRDISQTTGASLDSGISLTVAAGTVDPSACQLRRGTPATNGMTILPISSDTTHPITLQTGVTMPAP